jgi:hypothetical protein
MRRLPKWTVISGAALAAVVLAVLWFHARTGLSPVNSPGYREHAQVRKVRPSSGTTAFPLATGKIDNAFTLVQDYFGALTSGDYHRAYAFLSPNLQKNMTYQSFAGRFTNVTSIHYDPSSLRIAGAGNFSYIFTTSYTTHGRSPSTASFTARLRCVNLSGGAGSPDWRIESLDVQPSRR